MTAWFRARFLFCSFGPLYLLLGVGLAVQHKWPEEGLRGNDVVALCVAIAAFLLSLITFQQLRQGFTTASPSRYAVSGVSSLDESVLSYMLSYIPPLMIDDFSSIAKVAPAIVFYAVLATILIRTDAMYVNPYFLLFRYRIFRAEMPSNRSVVIITTKSEIVPGEVLSLHEIQPSKLFFGS